MPIELIISKIIFFSLKGKVFPKLKRRGKGQQQHLSSSDYESSDSTDYVFRILNKATRQEYSKFLNNLKQFSFQ